MIEFYMPTDKFPKLEFTPFETNSELDKLKSDIRELAYNAINGRYMGYDGGIFPISLKVPSKDFPTVDQVLDYNGGHLGTLKSERFVRLENGPKFAGVKTSVEQLRDIFRRDGGP